MREIWKTELKTNLTANSEHVSLTILMTFQSVVQLSFFNFISLCRCIDTFEKKGKRKRKQYYYYNFWRNKVGKTACIECQG